MIHQHSEMFEQLFTFYEPPTSSSSRPSPYVVGKQNRMPCVTIIADLPCFIYLLISLYKHIVGVDRDYPRPFALKKVEYLQYVSSLLNNSSCANKSSISESSNPLLEAVRSDKQAATRSAPSAASEDIRICSSWPSRSSQMTSSGMVSDSFCSVNVSVDKEICHAKIWKQCNYTSL